jgi:hypothetical protein
LALVFATGRGNLARFSFVVLDDWNHGVAGQTVCEWIKRAVCGDIANTIGGQQ